MHETSFAHGPGPSVLKMSSSDFSCSLWRLLGPSLFPWHLVCPQVQDLALLSVVLLAGVDGELCHLFHTAEH